MENARVLWEPNRQPAPAASFAQPGYLEGMKRGVQNRCPCCGEGTVFRPGLRGYLKVVPECGACHAPLGDLRADDAPPYFTIMIVGHLLVPLLLWVEKAYEPPIWVHMAIWLPLFAVACVAMLRPVKGAVVGWMCALGFDAQDHGNAGLPAPQPDA